MDKARLGNVVVMAVAAMSAAACGSGRGGKGANMAERTSAPPSVCPVSLATTTKPIGWTGFSSTLALAKVDGRRVAFIADEDAKSIITVDLDTSAQLAETRLGTAPAQIYVAKSGRIFTTLRDKGEVVAFTASRADAPLTTLCGAKTASEPIAIAATPDDAQIVVTSGWGRRITAFDAATLAPRFEASIPREPRSVVVSDDGKTAFVSHAVGSVMSAIDLAGAKHEAKPVALRGWASGELQSVAMRKKQLAKFREANPGTDLGSRFDDQMKRAEEGRPTCQGFALAKSTSVAGRIFAPQVAVEPGDPSGRPDGYGDQHTPTETPSVAVIDEGSLEPLAASVTTMPDRFISRGNDKRDEKHECLLPRAAAIDPATKSLLVTCYGIDAVVAYDATAANPLAAERRRWTVGSGPSGVVVDTDKRRAIVWAQFDRSISSFSIGGTDLLDDKTTPLVVQKHALAPLRDKLPAEYALGRILFHAAGDSRIAHDGRACASCHPDGRDDAITWATPEGPRRSIMLAGRVTQTAPYSWNGDETSLHGHLGNTFDRLSGKGLRSIELDALVTYISSMPTPPLAPAQDKAKADRGKQIFASAETGCASCHSGAAFSDGRNHDVGSKDKSDRQSSFNTPSLHLVGGTGPYFHDGRYTSLNELLVKSDGKMGHTKHLTTADIEALETFLRTL